MTTRHPEPTGAARTTAGHDTTTVPDNHGSYRRTGPGPRTSACGGPPAQQFRGPVRYAQSRSSISADDTPQPGKPATDGHPLINQTLTKP